MTKLSRALLRVSLLVVSVLALSAPIAEAKKTTSKRSVPSLKKVPPTGLEPSFGEVTCENLVDMLVEVKTIHFEKYQAHAQYMDDVRRLLESLSQDLEHLEKSNKALPHGVAQTVGEKAIEIEETQGAVYSLGDILEERMLKIIDKLKTCRAP